MAYRFDLSFQRRLLASVITDAEFLKLNSDAIKPEYFGDDLLRGIAEAALNFYTKEREAPAQEALLHEIKKHVAPGRDLSEYVEEIKHILDKGPSNSRYYQDRAVEFARNAAVANAVREAVPLLEIGEIEEVGRRIAEAVASGSILASNLAYDYFDGSKERTLGYLSKDGVSRDRIPTGFYLLDDMMQGGLGKGELGTVIALIKHGKTTTLINMAANAVLAGKKVVYFTLELSKNMIAQKFDSRFFGKSVGIIKSRPGEFARAMKVIMDKINGRLHIVEFPTGALTVDKMGSIVAKIGGADVVFLDYSQLLKPSVKRDDRRFEISDAYLGLRRVAGELQVPIWTAHQVNRTGVNAKIILPEHIAEDFNSLAIVDIGISINTVLDGQPIGRMVLYNMVSRIGPSGKAIECQRNFETSHIGVVTDEDTFA